MFWDPGGPISFVAVCLVLAAPTERIAANLLAAISGFRVDGRKALVSNRAAATAAEDRDFIFIFYGEL